MHCHTLFESFPTSYKYVIIVLKMMSVKQITIRLIHETSKHKEKEVQSENVGMVLR